MKRAATAQDRIGNLNAALEAAHRLRTQRIYTGTLQHWETLLAEANQFLGETAGRDDERVRALALKLDAVVAARLLTAGRPAKFLSPF